MLRGVSELEHVNKHSLDHCIERHTRARCTGGNSRGGVGWGELRAGIDRMYFLKASFGENKGFPYGVFMSYNTYHKLNKQSTPLA